MLSVLGHSKKMCDGVTRRELMRVGGLSLLAGLSMPELIRAADDRRAKARSVIMFNLLGGPAHMDMFDLKPDAPAEVLCSQHISPPQCSPIATSS